LAAEKWDETHKKFGTIISKCQTLEKDSGKITWAKFFSEVLFPTCVVIASTLAVAGFVVMILAWLGSFGQINKSWVAGIGLALVALSLLIGVIPAVIDKKMKALMSTYGDIGEEVELFHRLVSDLKKLCGKPLPNTLVAVDLILDEMCLKIVELEREGVPDTDIYEKSLLASDFRRSRSLAEIKLDFRRFVHTTKELGINDGNLQPFFDRAKATKTQMVDQTVGTAQRPAGSFAGRTRIG
jgi:hypothetical protein